MTYNAESTLEKTLDRIPVDFRPRIAEILMMDDASHDATFLAGWRWSQQEGAPPTVVMRHTKNLGYGGNQKAGYHLAMERGLDIVVMLHGDGQYAPELLAEMVAPIESRRGRRGVRLADDGGRRRPPRRNADLQVARQPDPDQARERAARTPASPSSTPATAPTG